MLLNLMLPFVIAVSIFVHGAKSAKEKSSVPSKDDYANNAISNLPVARYEVLNGEEKIGISWQNIIGWLAPNCPEILNAPPTNFAETHDCNMNDLRRAHIVKSREPSNPDLLLNRNNAKNADHIRPQMHITHSVMIGHSILNGFAVVVTGWHIRLPPIKLEGIATTYAYGDGFSGDTFGCVRESRRLLGSSRFRDDIPAIAMRPELGVPCGGIVHVEHAGKRTIALRMDSGPYGRYPDGRFKGVADLLPGVAEAIGLPGRGVMRKGWVRLRWW